MSAAGKIECNACPVLCQITEGRAGACDRYANVEGRLVRVDPVVLMSREPEKVPFASREDDWTATWSAARCS